MNAARTLRQLVASSRALVAAAVFKPLSARLAQAVGFDALQRTIVVDELLAIERETLERP